MSDPAIFDRKLLRTRRKRARALGPETFLIDRVADELGERLGAVLRQFDRAVDLGTPSDAVRSALVASGKVATIISAEPIAAGLAPAALAPPALRIAADEEALPFADGSLDLVVSALALQFVNDLPGTLIQIRRALKPDGFLLAALIGGDSLTELREAFTQAESEVEGGLSPRVAPFADVRELGALLQRAGFALPVVDSDRLTVRYPSVFALMRDLRRMGATNVLTERRRVPLRRATLQRMTEIYAHALPIRTAACARRSKWSGCPAGRRMPASRSRSNRARPRSGWPMHSAPRKYRPAKKPADELTAPARGR